MNKFLETVNDVYGCMIMINLQIWLINTVLIYANQIDTWEHLWVIMVISWNLSIMSDIKQTEVCLCRGLYIILHVRQFGGYRPIYTFQKLCPLATNFGEKPFLTVAFVI